MSLQNNYLGISKDIYIEQFQVAGVSLYNVVKRINTLKDFPLKNEFLNCGGVDFDKNKAEQKATSEVYERYAMSLKSIPSYINISFGNINENEIKNRSINNTIYNRNKIKWIESETILKNKKVLLPEEFINFKVEAPSGLFEINSNGFSCHTNKENSTISGLLEVIERHVVLNSWISDLNIYNIPELLLDSWCNNIISFLKKEGWLISVNFINNKLKVPTVWFLGCNRKDSKVMFGAKSSYNLEKALEGAFFEFIANFNNEKKFSIEIITEISNKIKIFNAANFITFDFYNKNIRKIFL